VETTHNLVALPVAQPKFPAESLVASCESAIGDFYVSLLFLQGKSKVSMPNDHGCTLHIDIGKDLAVYSCCKSLGAGRGAFRIRGGV
jgi:hypothetical protein